ncbi:MAG TPA: hypothetical protein VFS09_11125 [Candidatus Eisenbacteria bacterium]|nr:hypothetical protein [Candidatus Eisenbacteria bacterium]
MRSAPPPRISARWFPLVLLLAFGLLGPGDVSALPGVGKLKKSAEEKAAKAAGVSQEEQAPAITNDTVVFDDVVLELTPARLEGIVATFNAAKSASAGRPELVEKLNKAQEERNNYWDKHEEEIQAVRQKRDDAELCRQDGLREMMDRKTAEYSQKALSDPAIRDKYMKIAQQYNAAAASGDTAATKAAQEAMMKVILPSREDTLEVYKKCPPVPAPLPSETKLDAMDKEIASLNGRIRDIDGKVSEAQAQQGGMTRGQFAMASERIQMYLSWRQSKSYSKSATRGFSKEEIDALEKYLEKLIAAMG